MKIETEMIKQGKVKLLDEEAMTIKSRIIANKLRNHEFNDGEKTLEIQKQNKTMMQKLYEIS